MVPLSGNFKTDNEDLNVISRTRVSRIINTVTTARLTLGPIYHNVIFPRDDKSINDNLLGFSCIFNFPNVIGAIDWNHIPMKAPKPKINSLYKRYEVCVASLKFANLVAKWPGLSHDAFEWTYFTLCDIFLNSDTRLFTLRQCITLEKIFVDLLSWTQVTPLKKRLTRPMPGQEKMLGSLRCGFFSDRMDFQIPIRLLVTTESFEHHASGVFSCLHTNEGVDHIT